MFSILWFVCFMGLWTHKTTQIGSSPSSGSCNVLLSEKRKTSFEFYLFFLFILLIYDLAIPDHYLPLSLLLFILYPLQVFLLMPDRAGVQVS